MFIYRHRKSNGSASDQVDQQTRRSLIKQGWSLIASQHCVLLPDLVNSQAYKSPQLHLLANRWQDRCLEVCPFRRSAGLIMHSKCYILKCHPFE